MSLSFREQAAIALYCTPTPIDASGATSIDAVDMAQELANECCEQWGHDPARPGQPTTCRRCGKETK